MNVSALQERRVELKANAPILPFISPNPSFRLNRNSSSCCEIGASFSFFGNVSMFSDDQR